MSTVGDTIMKALGILGKHGWCKNELKNSAGQYCAVGAVNMAAVGVWSRYALVEDMNAPEFEALVAHIPANFDFDEASRQLYGGVFYNPSAWDKCAVYNNTRTSYDEIKSWFEKTALDEGISLE